MARPVLEMPSVLEPCRGRLSLRPAHWTNWIEGLTMGDMLWRLRRAKVRTWSSEIEVGGGVDGGSFGVLLPEMRPSASKEVDEVLRWCCALI